MTLIGNVYVQMKNIKIDGHYSYLEIWMNFRLLPVWTYLVADWLLHLASDKEDASFSPCCSTIGPVYVKIILVALIIFDTYNVAL